MKQEEPTRYVALLDRGAQIGTIVALSLGANLLTTIEDVREQWFWALVTALSGFGFCITGGCLFLVSTWTAQKRGHFEHAQRLGLIESSVEKAIESLLSQKGIRQKGRRILTLALVCGVLALTCMVLRWFR